jgi:class 3 adenylate cyclase/plastocyanin
MGAEKVRILADKDRYVSGESIHISGKTSGINPGEPVFIQVYDPQNKPLRHDVVRVTQDGSYAFGFKIGGKREASGDYKVVATSGEHSNNTSFRYVSDQFGSRVVIIPFGAHYEDKGKSFAPFSTDVRPNDTVTWINQDTVPHMVASGDPETGKMDGKFNSGFIIQGGSSTVTIKESGGQLRYFCPFHPWENGIINIQGPKEIVRNLRESVQVSDNVSAPVMRAQGRDLEIIEAHKRLAKLERHFPDDKIASLDYNDIVGIRRRLLTIVFWDIRNFTQISEILSDNQISLVEFLQDFYSRSTEVIFKFDGILDKTMGDGVLALFCIPNKDDNGNADAVSAVSAAVELRKVFETLRQKWLRVWKGIVARNMPNIGLRCAINTGFVTYGNIGTPKSDQLAAIGSSINIASRILTVASKLEDDGSSKIVISATTKERIHNHFNCISVGTYNDLKNVTGEFEVFEVFE